MVIVSITVKARLPPGHGMKIKRTQEVQKATWTHSERLMYVQFRCTVDYWAKTVKIIHGC